MLWYVVDLLLRLNAKLFFGGRWRVALAICRFVKDRWCRMKVHCIFRIRNQRLQEPILRYTSRWTKANRGCRLCWCGPKVVARATQAWQLSLEKVWLSASTNGQQTTQRARLTVQDSTSLSQSCRLMPFRNEDNTELYVQIHHLKCTPDV